MGVLTIDEGGEQRAFRISEGVLTVGSGEEADLRLVAEDVALVHADLECEDEALYVVPRPGVVPPRVHGVELKQKTRLGPGQELRIGSARLVWRAERAGGAPGPAAASAASPRSSASRSGKGRVAGARSGRSARRSGGARRGGARGASQGIPSWVVVVGILAAVGAAGFLVMRSMQGDIEGAERSSTQFHLRKAEELIESLNVDAARNHLTKIPVASLEPADRDRYDAVEQAMESELARVEQLKENAKGSTWFEFKLEDYEKRYLSGDPDLARVRLFLERCAEFRERWPQHPELDWVARQERRFQHFPGLDYPLDFADVAWRAKVLTSARPRDYAGALAMLVEFRDEAESSTERIGVDRLVEELRTERAQYHEDQLLFARREYDKGNVGRATEWLVQSILGLGDEAMENEAAEILVRFPGAESVLLGYRESRPEDFERLAQNPVIAKFLGRE